MRNNTFHWDSYGITDVGKVRTLNEDAFIDRRDINLWVVADGMGGHTAGDVASQMIVEAIRNLNQLPTLIQQIDAIEDSLLDVNKKLIALSRQKHNSKMVGSTVVTLLNYGKYCFYSWAGDSRLYRLRKRTLVQLTKDHTYVEDLIEQGLLLREDASNHPERNAITRGVGAADELFLDLDYCEIEAGDVYLLCSDGLEKEMSDKEIEEVLLRGDIRTSADELIRLTLERGARDNVTIILASADKI